MGPRNLLEMQQERTQRRKGLLGRGISGCFSLLLSSAVSYVAFLWVDQNYNLRRLMNIPRNYPGWIVDTIAILALFIVFQLFMILLFGFFWKLSGRDKKVADKMEELYDHWDEIQ